MMKPAPVPPAHAWPIASVDEDRPAYAETDYPHRAFRWSSLRALRTGKYLYIRAPERELYNQTTDPDAAHNLAASAKAVTDTLAGQLDAFPFQDQPDFGGAGQARS